MKKNIVLGLFIAVFAFILYIQTVNFSFVNYDDPWLIKNNKLLHKFNAERLQKVWTDVSLYQRLRLGAEYLPLRDTSVMLDYAIWGSWIGGHHLTNTLLFAVLCGLVFFFSLEWSQDTTLALFTSLLFAVHPIHVESVAWLSERKGLLSACFLFMAGIIFLQFAKQPRVLKLSALCVCLAGAVWSKAIGFLTVFFLLLCFIFLNHTTKRQHPKKVWIGSFLLLGFASVITFFPFWFNSQQVKMVSKVSMSQRWNLFIEFLHIHTKYLSLMSMTNKHSIMYELTGTGNSTMTVISSVIIVFLVSIFVWILSWKRESLSVLGLGMGVWFLFLLPVSQFLMPLQNKIADRYLLLPSFGFCFCFGYILSRFSKHVGFVVLSVLVVVGSSKTFTQTKAWSSSISLYKQSLKAQPNHVELMVSLSQQLRRKDSVQAKFWIERAVKKYPNHAKALLHHALYFISVGKMKKAIAAFKRACKHKKGDKACANLAVLQMRSGNMTEASKWAKRAVEINPFKSHNLRTYGLALFYKKKFVEALELFQKAQKIEPYNPRNTFLVRKTQFRLGSFQNK